MRRFGLLLLVAALGAAPAASGAKRKHLKLAALVTGQRREMIGGFDSKVTLYSVKQGSKKVGTLVISPLGGCAGNTCPAQGTANLSVGKVKGKATLKTVTKFTGCVPCSPPIPTKFKSNTGEIFHAKGGSEAIRVNGAWPHTKGSKVAFTLSY